MSDDPPTVVPVDHVEPVPRRIRATVAGRVVLDTTRALYVWEWPYYPQYYIPMADVDSACLIDEGHTEHLRRGTVALHGLQVGETERPHAARLFTVSPLEPLVGHVRFDWEALDGWFEEDEEVFVHPRSPYTRVDALRSTRRVRVELGGVALAESSSPVLVFETGLPTRYYLNRTEVDFGRLIRSDTVTSCPYKGRTTGYWSARVDGTVHDDIAWAYDFPTGPLLPIAGLVAFYNERVDMIVEGDLLARPTTHFSK